MALSHYFLTFLLLVFSVAAAPYAPRLGIPRGDFRQAGRAQELGVSKFVPDDYKTFFYNQTLDHFNYRPESDTTFTQKYVINSKYWGGANSSAPIFAYLGEEAPLAGDIPIIGFLPENAPRFKALLLYIEHRFYGESIPYGLSLEKVLQDANTRGYFSSAQALADYAEIILHVKQKLGAEDSPVIVVGASYGGMLASWFRLKYPHIAYGALASSAPILLLSEFIPNFGYYDIVSKDFRETSETCYETIKSSWSEIDRVAAEPNGLTNLSMTFRTCKPLGDLQELKNYLTEVYAGAAQYNNPHTTPVGRVCDGIANSQNGSSILGRIFSGVVDYKGNLSCYVNPTRNATQTDLGWGWQSCSDIVYVMALSNDSMFQADPGSVQGFIDYCTNAYGVAPRPHWAATYYVGRDIKLALRRFASNIIFSNGLVDPYSSGGVLENLSSTLRAVYTVNGSHCLDILTSRQDDPEWLLKQRKTEISIISRWLATYYVDLYRLK